MIIHRLIATLVLALLVYYLDVVLGWQELESRIAELGWSSILSRGRAYDANPFELYLFTCTGWGLIVFSQVWGGWLSDPHNYRAWPYVVGGWFCMLAPSVVMLYAGGMV